MPSKMFSYKKGSVSEPC